MYVICELCRCRTNKEYCTEEMNGRRVQVQAQVFHFRVQQLLDHFLLSFSLAEVVLISKIIQHNYWNENRRLVYFCCMDPRGFIIRIANNVHIVL